MKKTSMIALLMLSASLQAATLEAIKERGFLKVGVYADAPPFGQVDGKGQFEGFDVELARELALDLFGDRNKVQFVGTAGSNRIPYLKTDEVDVIMAHFTKTPLRAQVVDFAEPYMKVELGIITPKKEQIKALSDLQGKTLVLNKGTTAEVYINEHYPSIKIEKYPQNLETFAALENGRAQALANDTALLQAWISDHQDYEMNIAKLGETSFIGPAVKKGNRELLNWLSLEMKSMRRDGRLRSVYDRVLSPIYGKNIKAEQFLVLE